MLKKTLLTVVAALTISAAATSISTPDANAAASSTCSVWSCGKLDQVTNGECFQPYGQATTILPNAELRW